MEENKKVQVYSNYKRKNKWLGIVDYNVLIIIVLYIFLIILILKIIPMKLEYLIYIFIFSVIPIIAILLINIGQENAIDMLIIILKYSINKGIFVKKEFIKNINKDIYVNKNKY